MLFKGKIYTLKVTKVIRLLLKRRVSILLLTVYDFNDKQNEQRFLKNINTHYSSIFIWTRAILVHRF